MNKYLFTALSLTPLVPMTDGWGATKKQPSAEEQKRPNIILFMVDDMGWQDTSLPFWTQKTPYNEAYETPNMERLAKQGMMFTQAYACNISSATRCSLITGANNARHRVTNWTLERDKQTDRKSETVELPDWNYNGVSQVEGIPNTYVGCGDFVRRTAPPERVSYHPLRQGPLGLSRHAGRESYPLGV